MNIQFLQTEILQVDIFRIIQEGFQKPSSTIFLFVILITSVVLFIFLMSLYSGNKEKKQSKVELNEQFHSLVVKHKLDDMELKYIEKMATFLKNPDKKYLLLTNPNIYFSTLKRISSLIPQSLEKSMTEKLHFHNIDVYSQIYSTNNLHENLTVYIIINKNTKIQGTIIKAENYLVVKMQNDYGIHLSANMGVSIIFHDANGMYIIKTKFIKQDDNRLYFNHTTNLRPVKKREFFRKKININVHVNRINSNEKPSLVMLIDISGGGLRMANPDKKYKAGDDLVIYFPEQQHEVLKINGAVVKTSNQNSFIHIKFNHLRQIMQDKIIRLVNTGK